jgi:hypothetical protein
VKGSKPCLWDVHGPFHIKATYAIGANGYISEIQAPPRPTGSAGGLAAGVLPVVCGKQNGEYALTVGQPILAAAGFQPASGLWPFSVQFAA